MEKYVYNKDGLRFERQKRSAGHIFRTVMKYFLASIALAALYYIIIAVFFSTSEEKRLRAENRLIEEKYGTIEEKVALLDDIVAGLEVRDRDIYSKIFDSEPIFPTGKNVSYSSMPWIRFPKARLSTGPTKP